MLIHDILDSTKSGGLMVTKFESYAHISTGVYDYAEPVLRIRNILAPVPIISMQPSGSVHC